MQPAGAYRPSRSNVTRSKDHSVIRNGLRNARDEVICDPRMKIIFAELQKTEGQLSEEDAASLIFRSPRRLRAIVLESTGIGYRKLRLLVKIDCAGKLLRETELTVRAISLRLKYRSARKFGQSFRMHIGFLPSEYRALHLLLRLSIVLGRQRRKTATQGHSTGISSRRTIRATNRKISEGLWTDS